MKKISGVFCLLILSVFLSSCTENSYNESAYEKYLIGYAGNDVKSVKALLSSRSSSKRIAALNILSDKINKEAKEKDKELYLKIMLDHFVNERNPAVRSLLVGIFLRDSGVCNDKVFDFLTACIDEGDCSEDAAFTLAALFPEKSLPVLLKLLDHPSRDICFNTALALCTIDSPNTHAFVKRFFHDHPEVSNDQKFSSVVKRFN